MAKIKVLIADDHAVVREGTRLILEQEPDMEVVGEAGDGEEAVNQDLDLSQTTSPCLTLFVIISHSPSI